MTETLTTLLPATGTYGIDISHSHVGFKVRHLMVSKTRGRFTDFDGTVTIADEPLESSLDVTVQMASIDTRDEQRDGHLRSPDFFDVEQYPTMRFRSTGLRQIDDEHFELDGELTVRDTTNPLTLAVTFDGAVTDPWGNDRAAFTARGELDREAFGLTWNQALEAGGVVVGKKVELEIEAELVKQA